MSAIESPSALPGHSRALPTDAPTFSAAPDIPPRHDAASFSPALQRAVDLVDARGAVAQLQVRYGGRVVLDHSIGCGAQDLFWIFSASKPFVAVLVHQLAERGLIDLDDPVARYWPRFGRHGKSAITVRHVLQHRAGLPTAGSAAGDLLTMTDWNLAIRRIERARPRWAPGAVPAYHFVDQGFILGELVQRVCGEPVADVLRREVLGPLGMPDTYLGLPREEWPRAVPVVSPGPAGRIVEAVLNRRETRRAVIPAAGVSTTAHDLATFYAMLLEGGSLDGVRVLRPETVAAMRMPTADREYDRHIGVHVRWAQGLQLGGPRLGPTPYGPMGRLSSPLTFGHNGSNSCIGWADPTRDLVVTYLTNRFSASRTTDITHLADVADALLAAVPAATR